MGEGTTRDHFGREAAAVITSAKGETEAATRPTARARRRLPALRQALSAGLEQLTSWCERERNRIEWVRPDAGALCCLRLRRDAFDDAHVAAFWDLLPHHTCRCAPEHQPLLVSDQGAAAVSWTPELERPRRHPKNVNFSRPGRSPSGDDDAPRALVGVPEGWEMPWTDAGTSRVGN